MGHGAVAVVDDNGTLAGRIGDLRIDPPCADQGHEQAARGWAEWWCAERGASRLDVRLTQPAGKPYEGYGVRGQLRTRRASSTPEAVEGVTARPKMQALYPKWLATEKAAYVGDIDAVPSHFRAPRTDAIHHVAPDEVAASPKHCRARRAEEWQSGSTASSRERTVSASRPRFRRC
ncbi:hypothetical protein [Streptomyces sp. NPDC006879]|uniref:hypothetical protein n=1 Tax=Streptomyces sp. NPDC006879 TaxID=3364767 RepID=UPI00369C74B2